MAISRTRSYECSREIPPGPQAIAAIGDLWARDLSLADKEATRATGDSSAKEPQRCPQENNHRRHSEELKDGCYGHISAKTMTSSHCYTGDKRTFSFIFLGGSTSSLCGEQLLRPFFPSNCLIPWLRPQPLALQKLVGRAQSDHSF